MKHVSVIVKKNEKRMLPFIWVDDKENEVIVDVELVGEGASVTVVGLFLGTGNNTLGFNTKITHKAPRTKSLTILRGVFRDKSAFSNDGLVTIQKGAKGSDGYFTSKVLLFDDAKGKSVPSLEIDENELKAGHASTVGKPDEEQLFYLQSRGLSEKQAIELIVSGFFETMMVFLSNAEQKIMRKRLSRSGYVSYSTL
ncbi:MAG: SufD family Fe-S cluster assembly protein [Candidatus Levybacteria bacterium]|nr:SufD family Fe-S cluster assembly protein [Candidatus Levybacteria bacterium]